MNFKSWSMKPWCSVDCSKRRLTSHLAQISGLLLAVVQSGLRCLWVSRAKTEPVYVLNRWVQGPDAAAPGGGADSETGWGSSLRLGGEGRMAALP